jgi:hypothetical protein
MRHPVPVDDADGRAPKVKAPGCVSADANERSGRRAEPDETLRRGPIRPIAAGEQRRDS